MVKRVDLRDRKVLLDDWFRVERIELRFERYDGGMSPPLTRLHLDRGEAAAVLLYHVDKNAVLLVEQFRLAAWTKADRTADGPKPDADPVTACGGWLTEAVAGKIDPGEEPVAAALRECEEETGYRPASVEPVASFYTMPGASSEIIRLFYAEIDESMRVHDGGGVDDEHEDIRPVWVPRPEVESGEAVLRYPDAKTVVALQWLRGKWSGTAG